MLEAPPGFEPGMEVLQTSALPLGYGAVLGIAWGSCGWGLVSHESSAFARCASVGETTFAENRAKVGAGNGIRTRDFDLGKVALYH